jgi:serine/threonine protein phosphatase PrpC
MLKTATLETLKNILAKYYCLPTMAEIESAGITDVGKKRKGNEDALFLDDALGLYIVADGMGGHQAGEVASKVVVETVRDYIARFKGPASVEELIDSDETLSKEANRLLSGIFLANRGVYHVSKSKLAYRGMGSTVSAVYLTGETLTVANVGDSPVFLIHNGNIELLSVIHTVFAEHAALDPVGARTLGKRFRHMLTRAIGINEVVQPDTCEIQVFAGDSLTICSDGLTDKLSSEEIFHVVKSEKPDKACRLLVEMANERGGDDNITVIVIRVKSLKREKSGVMGIASRIIEWLSKFPLRNKTI